MLRIQVCSNAELSFLMEVHDGFSAAIAERTGFEGLWTSATSIACSLGYRNASKPSWNQVMHIIERIVGSTELPVLVDGDVGLGNANNVGVIAHELRRCGAAGLALEDSSRLKTRQLVREQYRGADVDKICSRVRAVRDAVRNGLVLVAGFEAPDDEYGIKETMLRALDCAEAGADVILLRSCKRAVEGIVSFLHAWRSSLPIVVVPAQDDPMTLFASLNVPLSAIIWGNHSMHAAINATRKLRCHLAIDESAASIERNVAIADDLTELLMYDELARAQARLMSRR
ncbi:isocitrate lyase/PEP mutase family protein [Bradyrhizobium centrosematis]|uniref:isocitrate lyase/PEP mutase family protein n=1 Tax=Bradyrhizobium centrosematis TaxID=1300039 RepID=UPI00388EAAF5